MSRTRYFVSIFAFLVGALSAAYSQTPLQFLPTGPCRLLDTRNGQPIMGGQTLPVQVAGACFIPANAQAYSFNVTVVPHGSLNYLTVWPAGQPKPVVSTLNSYDGRTKAVAAIIPAGTGGQIEAYATNTTDLILDINGYFVSSLMNTEAFYALPPCRLHDTRGGNYIHAMQTVNFTIQNLCGVPSTASTYSLNFTALPRTRSLNYLTAWPAGNPQPATSTLNAPTGAVTANAALVGGGENGEISVFAYDDTDLIIDVNGYFDPPGGANQLALYTLAPCRVLDTRPNYFSGAKTVQVESSPCNVPVSAAAYIVNATVIPQTTLGYLTLWPDGQQPTVSTLNAYDGAVTSNMAIVPADTANGTFQAYASNNTNLLIDIFSYMGAAPLGVATTSLTAIVNQPFLAELLGSGGVPPYTWTMTGGSLPPGLSFNSQGVITGTPTAIGLYSFTVQITDSQHNMASATVNFVVETAIFMITTTQLPSGTVGVPYSATLGATGGLPPYTWSLVSGSLPSGLSLNSSGVISGTPNGQPGVSNFVVQVTDSGQQVLTGALQMGVNPGLGNFSLNGYYAFAINGYQSGSPFLLAGSLLADGNGTISNGILDLNTGTGSPTTGTSFTGTYTVGGAGVGTMSLNAVGLPAMNFHLALAANGQGEIIWDNADPNPRGSGLFLAQTQSDFYPPQPGAFAIGSFGADSSFNRYAKAGQFQVTTGGVVSSGSDDVNDNGVLGSDTFTGQFFGVDTRNGRNLANFTINSVVNHYAYYTIRQGHVLLIGIDPLGASNPMTLGTILVQQTSSFSKASLQAATVIDTTGLAPNNGSPVADVVLGLGNWDGNGNGSLSLDENRGGTISQQQTSQGTYTVAANGRTTLAGFSGTPPLIYLVNFDEGFILGQDNSVAFGNLLQQSGSPFSNPSIFGTYLGGTLDPAQSPLTDSVAYFLADGNGNLVGQANTSGPPGPGTQPYSATYQVDSTGRAVVTGAPAGFMYVISPSQVVLLPSGDNPILSFFATGLTN